MKKYTVFFVFVFVHMLAFSQFFEGEKGIHKKEGFFNFYYDENKDKIYLEVNKLNEEFLYVHSLSEGLGSNDIGLDRGQLGGGEVVFFKKTGNKLLLIQPNQDYRAITNNDEERKSVKEAFAKSVLYGFTIIERKDNSYLIDITNFLLSDAHNVSERLAMSKEGNYKIDKNRSAVNIERTKGFPKNVEFDMIITYTGKPKGEKVGSVTPNAKFVTVHQHHSFVELPDSKYQKRIYDPRCGSWQTTYMDYAIPVDEPIVKRYITRHRLEKKNPNTAVSEAKKPIIYYLDRGTPEPIRSALLEGARWWNQAFEAIGYKNAFQVKILPEKADPLDVRYNMIQWVHRSTRGWSYGGSITDPRTGEIIKGHVSLGSLRIRQDFLIAQALQAPYKKGSENDKFALEMALARIRQLSAHEVGHTLGFAHNFAASSNNRASVMDYPHPKLSLKNGKIDFSKAYDTKIGAWDKVTVAYAYQDFVKDEEKQLQEILEKAFSKGLRFISDQDARPKGSAHAYAHLWDNGASAPQELENVLAVRNKAIANFSEDNIRSKTPYSVLEDVFVPLYFFHRYQTDATSKLIGGLDYTYAVKGQKELIVKKVDGTTERKALKALLKTISVEELAIPKRLLAMFPPRAYGYDRTRESFKSKVGVSFDPFAAVQTASNFTLSFLLHPERVNRIIQHKSLDSNQLGLEELLEDLFKTTLNKKHKDTYHQALQEIINEEVLNAMFALISNKEVYMQAKRVLKDKLKEIEEPYLEMISDFQKDPSKYVKNTALKIPDGSPIGVDYKH